MPYNKLMQLKRDQRGMMSFFVTMIMMIVITLIVLGFADLSRHNQQQALDRQLSSEAYYAAETGVNDAVSDLNAHILSPSTYPTCTGFPTFSSHNNILASSGGSPTVSYTCLMVNPNPATLEKKPLNQEQSVVWPLANSAGGSLGAITINWKATGTTTPTCNGLGNNTVFPQYDYWSAHCNFGLLRVDLFDGTSSNDPTVLASHTKTFFVKPTGVSPSGNTVVRNYTTTPNQETILKTICSRNTGSCGLKLQHLDNTSPYYIRITMYYQDSSDVTLQAHNGGVVYFKGAEAVIDSTGQAQGELRRIQVRVPLNSGSAIGVPPYALQASQGVCKQLTVGDTSHPLRDDNCE